MDKIQSTYKFISNEICKNIFDFEKATKYFYSTVVYTMLT